MPICPIFIHAEVASGRDYFWNVLNPKRPLKYIECLGSRCQMWDGKRNDCGLKNPASQPPQRLNIDPKHYAKGEPPPSEPE